MRKCFSSRRRAAGIFLAANEQKIKFMIYLQTKIWAISSAGSEHLPYKQGVTGSNPVSPTKPHKRLFFWAISSVGLERLLDRQEVTSSNLVLPTSVK